MKKQEDTTTQDDHILEFRPPEEESAASRYLKAVGPVLAFILIYEVVLSAMQTFMMQASVENPGWQVYTGQHASAINTAFYAAAMTLASIPFWKQAMREIQAFADDWNAGRSFGGHCMRRMASGRAARRGRSLQMSRAEEGAPAFRWREVEGMEERTDTKMPAAASMGIRLVYGALFVGSICLSIGCNIFLTLLQNTRNILAEHDTLETIVLQIVVFGFLTPLLEEAMFRGITYPRIKLVSGKKRETLREVLIAAGFSAVLFGVYHMNLKQGIYAAIMGMVFAMTYELIGNFAGVWLLHGACNIISILMSAQFHAGQNAYSMLVTPVWGAVFLATAAICGYAIYLQVKR